MSLWALCWVFRLGVNMEHRIDKGKPVPPHYSRWKELVRQMNPGDSILLSAADANRFSDSVRKCFKDAYRIVTRAEGARKRCWLTECGP